MAKKANYYREELAKLLGLELPVVPVKIPKKQIMAIDELETQRYREAEGIAYFLKAPQLFVARECLWCGSKFLVSRRHIAYCSYDHLKSGLNRMGIQWNKDSSFEAIVHDEFQDNEPIWIRNISQIKEIVTDFEHMVPQEDITDIEPC